MCGTRADADDVVQEAFLRWTNTDRAGVHSPRAFLSTVVTRLCIDRRREIQARKETYVGPWLPEPIVETESGAAEDRIEVAESVSLALLHVLETLSPVERAAYLLRKVFDYEYCEISEIIGKPVVNCRQLVSRAEAHVLSQRPRFEASPDDVRRICDQFLSACTTGDLDGLVRLLADDVVIYTDGGGKVAAALRPLEGTSRASRFLLGVFKKAPATARALRVQVNGQAGLAFFDGETLIAVWTLDVVGDRIRRGYLIRNPDKLARVKL